MFENRLGFVATLGFARMPGPQVAAALQQMGYKAVSWTAAHFNPRTKSLGELRELIEATLALGMEVSEVIVQQDYVCLDEPTRDHRVRMTIETISACAEVGVERVNLFTGPAPWDPAAPVIPKDISQGSAWDMVVDAFNRIVPVLQNKKVKGCLEGVWGHLCHDYFSTRRLLDQFNNPFLGVNFDPSHDVLAGNVDTSWLVRQWGKERIHHVHLKDAAGVQEHGKFVFPMLGEGMVRWQGMLRALRDINYDGYLTIEFESFMYHNQVLKGDTAEAARRCIVDARALLQSVK